MSDRNSMRGSRMGATSYELDKGVVTPKLLTTYVCPAGHQLTLPFAAEADEIPDTWNCDCGQTATRWGVPAISTPSTKVGRTHYDMLLERRSVRDLEALLKERLELVRGSAKKTA